MRILLFSILSNFNLIGQIEGVNYNFDCCNNTLEESSISFFSDLEKDVLNHFGDNISIQEEIIEGQKFHELVNKEYSFIVGQKLIVLNTILQKIISNLPYKSPFNYKIYLIDSKEINAITIGGVIYLTSSIYDFCESKDQIALIIAHEIAHNELNHINEQLKRIKSSQSYFGEVSGNIINNIGSFATISFNQKNEVYADMFGSDLLKLSNFDLCKAILIWEKMEEINQQKSPLIFSSHPYSNTRFSCLLEHIKFNYNLSCN